MVRGIGGSTLALCVAPVNKRYAIGAGNSKLQVSSAAEEESISGRKFKRFHTLKNQNC